MLTLLFGHRHRKISLMWVLLYFLTLPLIPFSWEANAQGESPLKKIRIAYSGISGSQAPAWLAYEKGFFRKYGLDVQLVFVEGGSRAVQTLISGDVSAAQVAGSSVIQSNLQGSGVVLIGGFLNTMDYKLVVARDITRPEQLKGKTVAVSRFGSSSDFATRYALEKYGLEPGKDVSFVQIGSQPARFAALEAGNIQGVMIAVPLTLKAKQMGFNTLADLQMLGLEYQHTGLAVTQEVIRSQPELVRDILRAFVEAIHFYKTRRRESLEILAKYLKTDDMAALEETYEAVGLALIPQKPYPTLKGINIMLQELAIKEPKAKAAQPEQFVDLRFIKELDSSGFIDRLYKPVVASREEPRVISDRAKEKAPAREEKTKIAAKPAAAQPEKPKLAETAVTSAQGSPTAPAEGEQYTIRAGDTLSKLAERFYGAYWKWGKIYEANRESVKNPDYIYIGQKIVIPPDDQAGT